MLLWPLAGAAGVIVLAKISRRQGRRHGFRMGFYGGFKAGYEAAATEVGDLYETGHLAHRTAEQLSERLDELLTDAERRDAETR